MATKPHLLRALPHQKGIINIALRGTTIGLKFVLSIILIKALSIDDYGNLGLIQSTIILATFVVGMDFYTYSSREILNSTQEEIGGYIANQFYFYFVGYILIVPALILATYLNVLDTKFFFYILSLIIIEHLSQEIYRILILLKKSVTATLVLFVRSGLWIIALVIFWRFGVHSLSLEYVLLFWLIGALISVILGFSNLSRIRLGRPDYNWIKTGFIISLPFFAGTIMYKIIEFSGRYFLDFYKDETAVGIFTFFSSIANITYVFVYTLVIIEMFPILVEYANGEMEEFYAYRKKFEKQILKFTSIAFLLSVAFIYPLLLILDEPALMSNILSFVILTIAVSLFCLSFASHFALYAIQKDRKILYSTFYGLLANLLFSFLLIPSLGVLGAAIAQLAAYLIILLSKEYFWKFAERI